MVHYLNLATHVLHGSLGEKAALEDGFAGEELIGGVVLDQVGYAELAAAEAAEEGVSGADVGVLVVKDAGAWLILIGRRRRWGDVQ